MLRTLLFCTLLTLLTGCLPAHAGHGNYSVNDMIEWIEAHSDYVYHGDPLPQIQVLDKTTVCGDVYPDKAAHEDCNIAGYYDHETNTIAITETPTDYMVEDHYREVVLLHELVHFLQYYDGRYEVVECKQALERDAFDLQDEWIDQQGIDPEQKNDPLFVVFATMCTPMLEHIGNTH